MIHTRMQANPNPRVMDPPQSSELRYPRTPPLYLGTYSIPSKNDGIGDCCHSYTLIRYMVGIERPEPSYRKLHSGCDRITRDINSNDPANRYSIDSVR